MATTTLTCRQCNFENEPERVYCHNCGAKLDRSLLPPEATKREDPVVVQERVRKMVSPRRGMGLRWLQHLVYCIVISAALAALLVLVEPPDNVPELSRDAVMSAPTITDDLDQLVTQPVSRRLAYTEEQVNAFLQSTIRSKKDNETGFIPLKFERTFVRFDEGAVTIFYAQTLFGLPIYASTTQSLQVNNGKLETRSLGGKFGRMPISPKIMQYLGVAFGSLWKVLERDRALVAKLQSITFHKKTVEMINRPATGG